MKTLAEFAKNKNWLEMVRFFASSLLDDGVSPNDKVLVTHHRQDDPRYVNSLKSVIPESSPSFPPWLGMTRANLVELPEGMTLGKLANYVPTADLLMEPIASDKATQNQVAAVMLLHGNDSQCKEALEYISIKPPTTHVRADATFDSTVSTIRSDISLTGPANWPVELVSSKKNTDWIEEFINNTKKSDKYTPDEMVTVNRVLQALEEERQKH